MTIEQAILRDADRCVLCGLCLQHCPTFALTGDEAESPRGRITLMMALARGQLQPSPVLSGHIDRCLGCLACEAFCPSEVKYARLLGNTRRLLGPRHRGVTLRWLARLLAEPRWSTPLMAAVRPFTRRGWGTLFKGRAGRLLRMVPRRAPLPLPPFHPVSAGRRGRVALFTGCLGRTADGEALESAIRLLGAFGYEVVLPEGEACCGAHHHALGDAARYEAYARRNLAAFDPLDVEAVLFVATGCGATLKGYHEWLGDEAAHFSGRLREATEFLARLVPPPTLSFRPLDESVAIHLPCSQSNALRGGDPASRLLRLIPGVRSVSLQGKGCCGAAGIHMIAEGATADALREPLLDAIATSGCRIVATTNVGCALHLAAGTLERGNSVEMLHPLTLLARQMEMPHNPCGKGR